MAKKKKREPLATGFLSKGNNYFNLKFGFTDEFSIYNKLGKDLIDFAWLDQGLVTELFEILWNQYVAYRGHKNDCKFIAAGLLDACEKLMKKNGYLTVYLLATIDFLANGRIDRRVLTYESAIRDYVERGYFAESEIGEIVEDDKRGFLNVFPTCIAERQSVVEKTLAQILGDINADGGQSAMARLYRLEHEDDFFREYWHSQFESYIGKINENVNKYASLTVLDTIDDMMRYELVQMILRDVRYKPCQSCGKLFIPSGRADSVYCDRIMPGQNRPCADVGANLIALEKRRSNPELRIYRQAYERLYKRVEMEYMTRAEFARWDKQARAKRDECHAGGLAVEEFERWIDETSRRCKGKQT